jgi:hypothetical protein
LLGELAVADELKAGGHALQSKGKTYMLTGRVSLAAEPDPA